MPYMLILNTRLKKLQHCLYILCLHLITSRHPLEHDKLKASSSRMYRSNDLIDQPVLVLFFRVGASDIMDIVESFCCSGGTDGQCSLIYGL
jgi:hypothetical protein